MNETTKTVIGGLAKTTAAALCYVLFFVTGVVFLVLEKDPYVRFHAAQSVVVFVPLFIIQWVLASSIIFGSVVPLVTIIIFVLWLVLIYKAWMGEEWEVPVFGVYARKLVKRVK